MAVIILSGPGPRALNLLCGVCGGALQRDHRADCYAWTDRRRAAKTVARVRRATVLAGVALQRVRRRSRCKAFREI